MLLPNIVYSVLGLFLVILMFTKYRNQYLENLWVVFLLYLPILFCLLQKVLHQKISLLIIALVGLSGLLCGGYFGIKHLIKFSGIKKRNENRETIAPEGYWPSFTMFILSTLAFWESIELLKSL